MIIWQAGIGFQTFMPHHFSSPQIILLLNYLQLPYISLLTIYWSTWNCRWLNNIGQRLLKWQWKVSVGLMIKNTFLFIRKKKKEKVIAKSRDSLTTMRFTYQLMIKCYSYCPTKINFKIKIKYCKFLIDRPKRFEYIIINKIYRPVLFSPFSFCSRREN
jgi:hypothetical protein